MKKLLSYTLAFILGALLTAPISAAINDNEAVYGRMLGTGVATALGSAVSGSGGICLTSNCVLTTPDLGTPSALALDNATQSAPVGVASLPTCNSGANLKIRVVTDSLLPAIGGVVSAGGALRALVICVNGTGWVVL